jgi:hypothetical protein
MISSLARYWTNHHLGKRMGKLGSMILFGFEHWFVD